MSETPTYKRIIEERLSHEIFSNDYLVKDSATEGTTRILISEFIDLVLADSATEEDLETAVHNFVPEYDSGTSYSVGNYCIYLNELYRCTTATTGDFDDSDWTATNAMSELVSLVSAEATARTTAINNEAYYRSMSDIVLSEDIAEPYNTTKSYVVGDIVSYNLYIYRCTGATTDTWDASKWEQVTVDELFDDLNFSADAISYDNTSSGLEADNVQDAIDETITKLSAVGSASGDIATFTDGSDLPMPKLEVAIEPQQDLHGYDAPWVGGSGKNKLNINNLSNFSNRGIDFVVAKNSSNAVISVSANGTVTGGTYSDYYIVGADGVYDYANIPSGSYILNGAVSSNAQIYVVSENDGVVTYSNGGDTNAFNLDSTKKYRIFLRISGSVSNIKFYPMIRLATVSDATFAPYSNICPIIGWDEVNVGVSGKNLVDWKLVSFSSTVNTPITLKQGTYTLSQSEATNSGNWYIQAKKSDNTYLTNVELGLSGWSASSTEGVYYGGSNTRSFTFTITEDNVTVKVGCQSPATTIPVQLEIGNQASSYVPYNSNSTTYTIDLDGTRYGGTLDVVSGVLTVDRAMKTLTNIVTNVINTHYFYGNVQASTSNQLKDVLSSAYKSNISTSWQSLKDGECQYGDFFRSSGQKAIMIRDNAFSNVNDYLQARGNETIVYPLETPIEVQLTPTVVKSLRGVNNVFADTGAILDAEYIRDLTAIIDYILEQLNA